ncbi:hypothetical protein [Nitrincola sp. MINF-07-Sa-05]|uniref:hypothetical protein n=1 Tax=Nitrincola salilacus TaxID=3400273 RepID=UPI003918405D
MGEQTALYENSFLSFIVSRGSPGRCAWKPVVMTTFGLYRLLKDLLRWFEGRKGNLSPADRLAVREKWKPVFEEKIADRRRDGLRSDVVVRDVNRLDQYPNIQEGEKGISA